MERYENRKAEEIVFSAGNGYVAVIKVEKEIRNTRLPSVPFAPKTGDDTNIAGLLVLALFVLADVVALAVRMKKLQKSNCQITAVGR